MLLSLLCTSDSESVVRRNGISGENLLEVPSFRPHSRSIETLGGAQQAGLTIPPGDSDAKSNLRPPLSTINIYSL